MSVLAAAALAALAGAALGALAVFAVFAAVRKRSEGEAIQQKEDLKTHFAAVAAEALRSNADQFLALAESRLATERVRSAAEVAAERQAVESSVRELTQLVRGFEKDRAEKYGSLEEQLRKATRANEQLQTTTDRLHSVLSNSRTRGQWGERAAEDILRAAGLQEHVQYVKNRAQDTASTRPDFAFLLPDGHKLHMDVKFPLDNYLRMVNAASEAESEAAKKAFLVDVKARIKELRGRDYVNAEEKTLSYVLLFIPNEQIYGFIQEAAPGLVDEALAQRVVLTSPLSLYAVLAVVRQSFDNFYFAQATQEILKVVSSFQQAYAKFRERFEKLGVELDGAVRVYQEIGGASHRMLESAMARIERLRSGQEAPRLEKEKTPLS